MELNETLQKVDMTLDSTVKKIEKQAKEIVNQELKIELSSGPKSMYLYLYLMKSY